MGAEIFVYIDLNGGTVLVGKLWTHQRNQKESASFEYDKAWLSHRDRFPLEPALMLTEGSFHTENNKALFGSIGDSAPDRWGRALMRRAERRRANSLKETPRTLREIDFLLMADDETRQGALRFSMQEGSPFLAEHKVSRIPPLIELPKLLSAAEHIAEESETYEELLMLLAPGSSLGGARPKASVRDRKGQLSIAKFPHRDDEIDIVLWEAVALTLASQAGITVPEWQIELVENKAILILKRFDRSNSIRIPFLSAMSMLSAKDNETRSYLEIVDALRKFGASPKEDMHALWRRIVFNIMISNTDDHLRNHGFLYQENAQGWRLSPAYDLNPTPTDIKPRFLSTNIDSDNNAASLELAFEVAKYFELTVDQSQKIVGEVRTAAAKWKKVAQKIGLSQKAIERMSSAFEHKDLGKK